MTCSYADDKLNVATLTERAMSRTRYDEEMDTVWRMRMKSEQKELIFDAALFLNASEFWRSFCVSVAHRLGDIKHGGMAPDEFGVWMRAFATQYKNIVSGEIDVDEATRALYAILDDDSYL